MVSVTNRRRPRFNLLYFIKYSLINTYLFSQPSTVPSSLFPSTCSLPAELNGDPLQNGTERSSVEAELNSYELVPDDSDPHIHRLSLEIEKERLDDLLIIISACVDLGQDEPRPSLISGYADLG